MKKILIPVIMLVGLFFTACTKTITDGANKINELELSYPVTQNYNTATAGLMYFKNGLFLKSNNAVDTLSVQVLIQTAVSHDITVSVAADNAALSVYNASSSTKYEPFPAAGYQIATPTVTIPAGQTSASAKIAVYPSQFDNSQTGFMLPVSISNDPGITVAQNLKTVYLHLDKDPFPIGGNYVSNGYFYHPSSPRALTNISKTLVKSGLYSVTVPVGDLGASGYTAVFTVDPATNLVTITAADGAAGAPYTMFTSGLPTSNPGYTPQWTGSASCNNTYDPATKTFKVRYGYMGATGWRVTEEILQKQ